MYWPMKRRFSDCKVILQRSPSEVVYSRLPQKTYLVRQVKDLQGKRWPHHKASRALWVRIWSCCPNLSWNRARASQYLGLKDEAWHIYRCRSIQASGLSPWVLWRSPCARWEFHLVFLPHWGSSFYMGRAEDDGLGIPRLRPKNMGSVSWTNSKFRYSLEHRQLQKLPLSLGGRHFQHRTSQESVEFPGHQHWQQQAYSPW